MKRKRGEPSALLRVLGLLVFASPLLATRLLSACHDAKECFAGDYLECQCDDESWGYAACDEKAEMFGDCVCDGTTPGVDREEAASSGGGDRAPLFEACESDEDCESGLCFQFNAKGPHCTVACGDGCPSESGGCNQKGVCKLP